MELGTKEEEEMEVYEELDIDEELIREYYKINTEYNKLKKEKDKLNKKIKALRGNKSGKYISGDLIVNFSVQDRSEVDHERLAKLLETMGHEELIITEKKVDEVKLQEYLLRGDIEAALMTDYIESKEVIILKINSIK